MIGAFGLSRLISTATCCPFISRHGVVPDYNINQMIGGQLQSLAAAGSGQNGVSVSFD